MPDKCLEQLDVRHVMLKMLDVQENAELARAGAMDEQVALVLGG
ncbi:hypothetical protein P3H15_52020 [Rhodococcus sp. T2V]|nr:hypothetical protein [Rhodococcus sp. T2V]MDF3313437.1 hypothetical protein [Rhodococcus sp. T2V]